MQHCPRRADDAEVNLFRRKPAPPAIAPGPPGFAAWLLQQFSPGVPTAALPYAEVERVCARAGSLLFGAAFARPSAFAAQVAEDAAARAEAALLSRRTADGFKASLADRQNAVIAWPWDHLATSVAWRAAKDQDTSESALGDALSAVAVTYALRHRDQLEAVLSLWRQVAGNLPRHGESPDLATMGVEMLAAYETVAGHVPAV